MEIIDYIDFKSLFTDIKKNQLEQFPDRESYIKELTEDEQDSSFVNELYDFLEKLSILEMEPDSSENRCDSILDGLKENKITIEFSIGGSNSNESDSTNYWGYGYNFVIDMENELFTGFWVENYS